jgi:hypothetical protein
MCYVTSSYNLSIKISKTMSFFNYVSYSQVYQSVKIWSNCFSFLYLEINNNLGQLGLLLIVRMHITVGLTRVRVKTRNECEEKTHVTLTFSNIFLLCQKEFLFVLLLYYLNSNYCNERKTEEKAKIIEFIDW